MRCLLRCLAFTLPLGLGISGCADLDRQATSSVTDGSAQYVRGDLGTLTYRAVDILLAGAPQITPDTPLVVASIADAKDVETSSALGNIVADMIRTRIAQDGHLASEVRLRGTIGLSKGEGEFLLSRNRNVLLVPPNAAAIVTGTYAASTAKIYISLKLISATDARILAGADFVLPIQDVSGLLHAT